MRYLLYELPIELQRRYREDGCLHVEPCFQQGSYETAVVDGMGLRDIIGLNGMGDVLKDGINEEDMIRTSDCFNDTQRKAMGWRERRQLETRQRREDERYLRRYIRKYLPELGMGNDE